MVNNCGVVVDAAGTAVLVDTTSTEKRTRAVLAEVAEVSTGAPYAVVNTHHHPDHTFGNGFLPAETLVIGHDNCREMVLEAGLEATRVITTPDYGDLVLRPPEITFSDRMTLHLREPGRRAAPCRRAGAHDERRPRLAARAPGAVQRRPRVQRRAALRAGRFRRRLPQRDRADAGARARRAGPGPRPGLPRRRRDPLLSVWTTTSPTSSTSPPSRTPPGSPRSRPHRSTATTLPRLGGDRALRRQPHRAYAEIDDPGTWTPLTVPDVWPDMVAFHGGPIECHA